MQSNKNMWLLFAVSPSAISDLSQAYAISSSPLAGELKGTNDSWSTDEAAQCVCERIWFKKERWALRLNPILSDSPHQEGGQHEVWPDSIIHSGNEHVYQPCYPNSKAYAARTSIKILCADGLPWKSNPTLTQPCKLLLASAKGL